MRPHPKGTFGTRLTRLIRSVSGFFLTWYRKSPPGIHFDTSWRGSSVTPMKGTIWEWLKCFHITASSQNNCEIVRQRGSNQRLNWRPACLTLSALSEAHIRIFLIQMSTPASSVPLYASQNPPNATGTSLVNTRAPGT